MPKSPGYSELSDLEREFELEMDEGLQETGADDLELEAEDAFKYEAEGVDDETDWDRESGLLEAGLADEPSNEYVERLMEISAREFESAGEVDQALNEVLDDMEREYLFGGIRRGLRSLSRNKLLRRLAAKGLKAAGGRLFPGLQGALQLARGNLKGALLNFGKQALGTVVPGGAVALDAVKAIGLGGGDGSASERETWENYVGLAREAFEHMADNLTETADRPAEASRLAHEAIQQALRGAKARAGRTRDSRPARFAAGTRVVQLRVRPGQRIKLVITAG